jgi:hypothetical protein
MSSVRSDLAKRQQEYRERREREAKQTVAGAGTSAASSPVTTRVKPLQLVEEAGAGATGATGPAPLSNQGK